MKKLAAIMMVTAPVAIAWTSAGADTFIRMVSGPAGGSWYPIGAKITEVLQKNVPGVRASNGPGGGTGNPRKIDKGTAELGWTFGFTAFDAYAGKDVFKKKHANLRFFSTLFPGILQTAVPAKSAIRSYADLANKNISPGKTVFSGNVTVERLLKLYGITYDGIRKAGGTIHRVGYSDSVALMKDGHIDAFVGLTSLPNSSFIALDFSPGTRLLPVEDAIAAKFVKQNPGFWSATIPAGSYKGQKKAIKTLATATVLITHKGVSDELVYKMTDVFWREHDEIMKAHSAWKNVKLADALKAATIPVHPGALKYYKEKGISK